MSDTATTTTTTSTSFNTMISAIFCMLAITQFIYATILTSDYNSQGQKWTAISSQVIKIAVMTLLGSFALFVVSVLYYLQNPGGIVYFILAVTLLTMNLAYAAYAFGAVRNK